MLANLVWTGTLRLAGPSLNELVHVAKSQFFSLSNLYLSRFGPSCPVKLSQKVVGSLLSIGKALELIHGFEVKDCK